MNTTTIDPVVRTDSEIGQQLIEALHRNGVAAYYWGVSKDDGTKRTYWHDVGKNGIVPKDFQTYFGVHACKAVKAHYQRATKEGKDVSVINCLFAEHDAKQREFLSPHEQAEHDRIKAAHDDALQRWSEAKKAWAAAGKPDEKPIRPEPEKLVFDLDAAKVRALAHIRSLPIQPSAIVDSGGGFHSYWILTDTFNINNDTDRDYITQLQACWVVVCGGDEGAKDLERVLRVPGTLNNKYDPPRRVTVVESPFTRHVLAELEAFAASRMPAEPPTETESNTNKKSSAAADNVAQSQDVIGAFNKARKLADIITEHGYTITHNGTRFTRANKKGGGSGYLNADTLFSFSSNDELNTGHQVDAFNAWCILEHGGDVKAAVKAAANALGITRTKGAASENASTPDTNPLYDRRSCDDIGNGYRFADQHKGKALYVHAWGWMFYDGKRWTRDHTGAVMRMAKQTVKSIWDEVKSTTAKAKGEGEAAEKAAKLVKLLTAHAIASRARGRLENMLAMAQSELPAKPEDFDLDPMLLNAQNGTINLETGTLRKHDPADRITKVCNAAYDKDALTPKWTATLERFLPANLIPYMKRSLGLAASGQPLKAFWFLFGAGDNGKSTITGTVAHVLGDYATKINIDALMSKQRSAGNEDHIAHLAGARFVVGNEVDSRALNQRLIKDLTGEMDIIRTKFMGQGTFEFKPQFKLFIYGNQKPKLDATDQALWNRVQCVPFEKVIPKAEQVKTFATQLKEEADGILAWLVSGCMECLRDGLNPPDEIVKAGEAYRKEMDVMEQFVAECCELKADGFTTVAALHAAYKEFTSAKEIDPREFSKDFRAKGFEPKRATGGPRGYKGVVLIAEESTRLL